MEEGESVPIFPCYFLPGAEGGKLEFFPKDGVGGAAIGRYIAKQGKISDRWHLLPKI